MIEGESAKRLLHKAVRTLARRAHSRGELRAKLRSGADEEDVNLVLQRLEELNLLNDEQYAYDFAHSRMKQDGWGPIRVLHSLLRRFIEPHLAESAIERIRREKGDRHLLEGYLQGYCSKHGLPRDQRSIQRLISHLQRRGFQEETIYSTLRQAIPATAWRCFDRGD